MYLSPGVKQEKEQKEESRSKHMLYVARFGTSSSSTTMQGEKSVRIDIQIALSNVIRCQNKLELCLPAQG